MKVSIYLEARCITRVGGRQEWAEFRRDWQEGHISLMCWWKLDRWIQIWTARRRQCTSTRCVSLSFRWPTWSWSDDQRWPASPTSGSWQAASELAKPLWFEWACLVELCAIVCEYDCNCVCLCHRLRFCSREASSGILPKPPLVSIPERVPSRIKSSLMA